LFEESCGWKCPACSTITFIFDRSHFAGISPIKCLWQLFCQSSFLKNCLNVWKSPNFFFG
jgi:hypothetical protein